MDDFFDLNFEEEIYQESLGTNPMMPWYAALSDYLMTSCLSIF